MSVTIANKYWVVVQGLFSVRDDGTIEYEKDYSPEKSKEAFDKQFPFPSHIEWIDAANGAVV